jgi:nitrogen fixation protein NifU and related proteins
MSMYSAKVLDHLENPRNAGEMSDATACGEATNPVCGDLLLLFIKVDGGKIVQASFKVRGCPPSVAAGSVLTEMITGLTVDEARNLAPKDITRALESLPRNKEHCSVLAIDALRAALANPNRRAL